MKHITFLGAAGTVTGSSFLLSNDGEPGLLIDMGMFQGVPEVTDFNYRSLAIDPSRDIIGVVLTHAHLDHSGRLPMLMKGGFTGKVYVTEATRMLAELTLYDAAKVAKENNEKEILYTERDVTDVLRRMEVVEYGREFAVGRFGIVLRDAGHILGSASVEVWDNSANDGIKHIAFSGDIGNYPEELVRPTEFISEADVVVMESTYGDRVHSKENADDVFTDEVQTIEKTGGALLIPAFSLERTQEILHKLDHLKKKKAIKDETHVYLDSPMAIKATMIYKNFRELYNRELTEHSYVDDPFDFPGLKLIENVEESHEIHRHGGPKVIIAGNGMLMGGRIRHHAIRYLPVSSTRLLIVGFQAEGTVGREILEGAKSVQIDDKECDIRAHVRKTSAMSAHADQPRLLAWLSAIKNVRRVFLVHGEPEAREELAKKINSDLHIADVVQPLFNDVLSLRHA